MKILTETMTRVVLRRGLFRRKVMTIRIWRGTIRQAAFEYNDDIIECANRLLEAGSLPHDIAQRLIHFERVNAVEIIDANGNGRVDYANWP